MEEGNWKNLRNYTNARIALGRAGSSSTTAALLDFRKGHAMARDAVYEPLREDLLVLGLKKLGISCLQVHSQAQDRITYLQRPDLGRRLNRESCDLLKNRNSTEMKICLVVADGLSSAAIHSHALPFTNILLQKATGYFSFDPIIIAKQSRVALGDEIAYLLNARLVVMLIGERPGLSSPDSMGIYMTYAPKPGLTDESRNCISNIHANGLSYDYAADKLLYLMKEALVRKISGVNLKENSSLLNM